MEDADIPPLKLWQGRVITDSILKEISVVQFQGATPHARPKAGLRITLLRRKSAFHTVRFIMLPLLPCIRAARSTTQGCLYSDLLLDLGLYLVK